MNAAENLDSDNYSVRQSNIGPRRRLSVTVPLHGTPRATQAAFRCSTVAVLRAQQPRAAQTALRCSAMSAALALPPQLDAPHVRAAQAALRCEAPMRQARPARWALKPHVFCESPAATADVSVRYLVFWIVLYHTL